MKRWALVGALALGGCAAADPRVPALAGRIGRLEQELRGMQQRQADAASHNESMFSELVWRTQCQSAFREAMHSIAECCRPGVPCTLDTAITANLLRADPYKKGYVLSMFLPGVHKAIYFNKKDEIMGDVQRVKQELQAATTPVWFPGTRFLVLSHPDKADKDPRGAAKERGKQIINLLVKELSYPGFPGSRLQETDDPKSNKVLHWVVPFSRAKERLPEADLMVGGSLSRSVWVFRVEC